MAISVLDVKLLLQYLLVFQIGALAHFQLCLQEHSFTLLKEERKKKRYPNGQQHSVHWNMYFFPIFSNVFLHSYVQEVNVNRERDCMGRTRSSSKRLHQLDDSRPHQLDTVTQRSLITTVHLCSSECYVWHRILWNSPAGYWQAGWCWGRWRRGSDPAG